MQQKTEESLSKRQEEDSFFRLEKAEGHHQMLLSASGFVSHCLSAESLEVGAGMLLAHPDVKHISLNIFHSPQTLLPPPDNGKCQTSNPITILLDYGDNNNGLVFPHLTRWVSSAGGSCCGEGKKEGISVSQSSLPGVTGNICGGRSYKYI